MDTIQPNQHLLPSSLSKAADVKGELIFLIDENKATVTVQRQGFVVISDRPRNRESLE